LDLPPWQPPQGNIGKHGCRPRRHGRSARLSRGGTASPTDGALRGLSLASEPGRCMRSGRGRAAANAREVRDATPPLELPSSPSPARCNGSAQSRRQLSMSIVFRLTRIPVWLGLLFSATVSQANSQNLQFYCDIKRSHVCNWESCKQIVQPLQPARYQFDLDISKGRGQFQSCPGGRCGEPWDVTVSQPLGPTGIVMAVHRFGETIANLNTSRSRIHCLRYRTAVVHSTQAHVQLAAEIILAWLR
jgi:hypothetical protein